MKRFTILILTIAFALMAGNIVDAKVKKSHHKAKTTATASKWIEITRSDTYIYYYSPDIKLQVDNDGYYIITFKRVPIKSYLESDRQQGISLLNNPLYKNYTHTILQYKVDIDRMRLMILNAASFANNTLLDIFTPSNIEWMNTDYDTIGYGIAKAARYIVRGY